MIFGFLSKFRLGVVKKIKANIFSKWDKISEKTNIVFYICLKKKTRTFRKVQIFNWNFSIGNFRFKKKKCWHFPIFFRFEKIFSWKYCLLLQPEICPEIQKSYLETRATNLKSRKSQSAVLFCKNFHILFSRYVHRPLSECRLTCETTV